MPKIEMKSAITTKSFITFVIYVIYMFATQPNDYKLWVNIGFVAGLLFVGLDKPADLQAFLTQVGEQMLDFAKDPQLKLQAIQAAWSKFSLLWLSVADEVAKKQQKNPPDINPMP